MRSGHCLGLKHVAGTNAVMYPTKSGANSPPAGELAAVSDAYSPTVQAPSPANRDAYYEQTAGAALRHFGFPAFTFGASNAPMRAMKRRPGPGVPLPVDAVVVRRYYLR